MDEDLVYQSIRGSNSGGDGSGSDSGYGSGGYGYGSSGSGGGSSTTTVTQHDTGTEKEKSVTNNTTDVTTTSRTNADQGGISNLIGTTQGGINSLIAAVKGARDLYNSNIQTNQELSGVQTLENNRNAQDSWLGGLIDLLGTNRALQKSIGNGGYGSAADSLSYLTRSRDDKNDRTILNAQRKTQNEIYEDLFSTNKSAENDFNESLVANQQELLDLLGSFISDYNSYLGNTNVSRNQVDEKTEADTTTNVDSTTKTTTTSSGTNSDVSNDTQSNKDITTNSKTTGNNRVDSTTTTDANPYIKDGNWDYEKLAKLFGLGDLSAEGSSSLGEKVSAPTLQEQFRYRSSDDKIAYLKRRY